MREVWSLLRGNRLVFLAGQISMLAAAAAGLAFPWTVRNLFSSVLDTGRIDRLLVSIAVLGAVLVGRELVEYLKRTLLGQASEGVVYTLREQVFSRLVTRALTYFNHRASGEIISVVSNDINTVQAGITSVLTNLVQQSVVLLTVVSMLFVLDAALASMVCLFVPPMVLVSREMSKRAARTTAQRQQALGEMMSIVQQSVAGIEVIRTFLLEGIAASFHRERNRKSLDTSVRSIEIAASSRSGAACSQVFSCSQYWDSADSV